MHVGEGWGGVLAEGERPERVASFACWRPWGPEGGMLAAVYECAGGNNRENAALISERLLPRLVDVGLSDDGDPRRSLRTAWTSIANETGDPAKNRISLLVVHVNADRLLCARMGGGRAYFVKRRECDPVMSYYDTRLQAHRISNEGFSQLLVLGTPGVWERFRSDYLVADRLFHAFSSEGIPGATKHLHENLRAHPLRRGTYAGVLIDLTPFYELSPGS